MPLTVADIEQKEFRTKFKGYDPEEVDRYLDDICDQMYALYQHIDMLQQRLAQSSAAPAYARAGAVPPPAAMPDYTDQAQNELNQARQKARGIIEEAQQDAREIRQQAEDVRQEAQAIRDEAQAMMDEAIRMQDEAVQEPVLHTPAMAAVSADEMEAMEARKAALQEEIDMLRATARDYRSRFQRLVEDQQHVLNAETELFD